MKIKPKITQNKSLKKGPEINKIGKIEITEYIIFFLFKIKDGIMIVILKLNLLQHINYQLNIFF